MTDIAQREAHRIVAEAVDRGVNYFDVAPVYGNAEERLGPALEPYRKKAFLACPVAILGDCAVAWESVKPLRDRRLLRGKLNAVYACPPMELRIRAAEMLD